MLAQRKIVLAQRKNRMCSLCSQQVIVFSAAGLKRRSRVTGHGSQVTGHGSQVTGHRSRVTGHRLLIINFLL